jgi:hypothetical protein
MWQPVGTNVIANSLSYQIHITTHEEILMKYAMLRNESNKEEMVYFCPQMFVSNHGLLVLSTASHPNQCYHTPSLFCSWFGFNYKTSHRRAPVSADGSINVLCLLFLSSFFPFHRAASPLFALRLASSLVQGWGGSQSLVGLTNKDREKAHGSVPKEVYE